MRKNKGVKHTPIGYFIYFYEALGFSFLLNIFLSVLLGLFDGVGLALFIPLLQFVNDPTSSNATGESMGGLEFIINGFESVGIPLNLFSVLGLILTIFLIKGILTFILSMQQVDLRQKYGIGTRIIQLKQLQNLSYKGLLELDAGRIQNSMTTELSKNVQAMNQFMLSTKSLIMLSSYIVLAFIANWQFALLIIVGGAISNLFFKKINENVKNTSILISERNSLFSGYLIQCINTFKYLKSTNYFEKYYNKLEKVNRDVENLNRQIGKNQSFTLSIREPLIIFIVVTVIVSQIYIMGSTLGSILVSLLLFYRALGGLMGLQGSWQAFMQNVGSIDSTNRFNLLMSQYSETFITNKKYDGLKKDIELKNIHFSYGSTKVLSDINLVIKKYDTIALVGESGSGKTTLANLIITLLQPDSGKYLIDGISINE